MQGMLEAFPLLHAGVAGGLLAALWPACAAREDVKDALVLAMRRSMFGRSVAARLLAARGFLFLITRELADDRAAAAAADLCSPSSCVQARPGVCRQRVKRSAGPRHAGWRDDRAAAAATPCSPAAYRHGLALKSATQQHKRTLWLNSLVGQRSSMMLCMS